MGNIQNREQEEKIYDTKKIYWDADGNLRHGTTTNNRDDELMEILQADKCDEIETALWMIIPSRWLRKWLLFAHYKVCDSPGRIDMFPLLQQDDLVEGGWRPKSTLSAPKFVNDPNVADSPGHYRRISYDVWLKFVDIYGVSGFAIAVLGAPADDKSRWRVFKNPRLINKERLPPPVITAKAEEEEEAQPQNKRKKSFFGF